MAPAGDGSTRLMLLFGAASLAAVAVGALVCALSGVPAGLWTRNLVAWLAGALAAQAIAATAGRLWLPVVLCATPAAMAGSFLGASQDGVHRWIDAGPLRVNVSMMVLPALVVALARARGRGRWASVLACLGLLALQPDASQATALGLAVTVVAARDSMGRATKAGVVAASAALVAAAWLRPDPLQAVAEVEGIIGLAFDLSPLLAGMALAALAGMAAAPILSTRRASPDLRVAGAALGVCLLTWAVTPFAGAFPVPLVGIGLSPVLGSWLGVGLLAGVLRRGARDAEARSAGR